MAQTYGGGFLHVTKVGFSAATGGASARTAIPTDGSGSIPNYVRIAARNECYIKIGDSAVVATTNDVLVQNADSVIMRIGKGDTHIAYIQGTAAGQVNVTPLDNS
ncbi:MAG: hypothetical protein RLZZ182_2544 [Pseudomonadota bacterium]|jgi:hypothetical protein